MIAKLTGKIEYVKNNYVVIDVNGVGYKVHVTDFTFGSIAGKEDVSVFVYTYVREDTLALYGFLELAEKEMFELLISISGIGPKAALGILSIAPPKTIKAAILNEDSSILTRVSGVGKKTAERVIRELQGKVDGLDIEDTEKLIADSDAVDALVSMGYSVTEAREALKNVSPDISDVGERVKAALRNVGS
ncbi:MAG: Holliday junction branch migration protein RuvA [Candidatus Moranbacteria bacterium]|nr:Holliday junction branch migration protein RuvA [Candidatus Moranbacteria bacterium]